MTATLNNTKGSVLLSKLPSVDLMASKSSQTGKKEFNHDRPSPRQKKKKKIKAGTRSLKMVDTTNKDVEKKPVKAKGVVTDYSQIKLQDNKDGKDKNDQKNKIEDVDKGEKDGKLVSDDKLQQEKKQKYQEVLQKLQTHGSTNKTGSNDKDARRSEQQLAQKRNLTSTKKPDDICQGKLCLPAYTLLIEEGLPSNITLNQVRGVHQNFASATEVFRVTSVGSHIETATCVQFPYQRAVLDAANVTVLWLNKSLTTTLGFLTTDKTLLHSVVLKQTVIMTGFAANATQLQLTSVLAGHFKPHLVSVTLHNSSAAVVKFDNATYVESILKRPQGNITIDQHLVVIEPALLVWNPLSPTIAPSKDDKDKLEAVSDIYSANRFQDNEELRYSLRSVEKFAPWVRHIYLVTNGQIPYWLDLDNPRLTIITHQEIFQNKSHLPTFSSPAIESHIHRIPGLSKKFIYMNDDVMFGQDIGPDDFYTHTRGQKAYLAWQVPHCAEGCPPTWITDKYCDKACNNSACDWDGGDCVGVSGRASSIYSGWRGAHGGLFASSSHFCNTGCADSWMGDRYCDSACNVLECGFDTGDCGVGSFNKMHGIEVTENVSLIHLPLGLKAVYFNLTASMDGRKITEGDVTKADVVRVAVIAQLYKTLTIVFHPKQNLTLLSIRIVSSEINKTKIDIRFNITVDTFTPLPAKPDVAPTSTVLANRTGNDTTMLTSKNGTEIISLWEEDIPMPKQPELFNSLDYVVPLFRNGTVLPTDVLSQLETLKHEYKIGDLTEKGYYRRKAKILREVVERNESFGQMVFGSEIPKFMVAVGNASSSEQLTGNRKNDSEDISKQQEEKVIQHSDDIDRPSSKKKDHGQTVPRESTLRKILWINEQESTSVEVKGDYGDWERTDDELYVAAWIANTKKKQLHLQEELEWTKSQWLENHSPQSTSPAGFRTRGVLPWEKQQDFDSLIAKIVSQDKYLKTEDGLHRKLLDAYADSLKYVNKLYNRKYGHVARKVPAHCPHMIDIDHMAELQAMFPDEYESTSSHNLRHPEDMQFAFSYYYYLIDEKIKFNLTEMFNAMDTDMSG
jgi:UDP-N-acetylglucosamine-lysosomal-enzyme